MLGRTFSQNYDSSPFTARCAAELRDSSHHNAKVPLRIDIAAPPRGDYGPALDAIFTPNLYDLTPNVPVYWQRYMQEHFPPPGVAPEVEPKRTNWKLLAKTTTPPVVLRQIEPNYTPYARAAGLTGQALVYLRVDTQGRPQDVRILKTIGLGEDDEAVLSVQQYQFQPAMRDGIPIAFDMNVEVNYQILARRH